MSEAFIPRYSNRATARGNFVLENILEKTSGENIKKISLRKLLPDYSDIEVKRVPVTAVSEADKKICAYNISNETLFVWEH